LIQAGLPFKPGLNLAKPGLDTPGGYF